MWKWIQTKKESKFNWLYNSHDPSYGPTVLCCFRIVQVSLREMMLQNSCLFLELILNAVKKAEKFFHRFCAVMTNLFTRLIKYTVTTEIIQHSTGCHGQSCNITLFYFSFTLLFVKTFVFWLALLMKSFCSKKGK